MKVEKRGGARPNSGRMKKDEVISLIQSMDAIAVPESVWQALYGKVQDGDTAAIKLWLNYRYGMPKETVQQDVNISNFNIKDIVNFK